MDAAVGPVEVGLFAGVAPREEGPRGKKESYAPWETAGARARLPGREESVGVSFHCQRSGKRGWKRHLIHMQSCSHVRACVDWLDPRLVGV